MKILVTGATSLLGRTVAIQLSARGDDVTCFQRSRSTTRLPDVLGDVRDLDLLERTARGQDALIHLAALVAPRPVWSEAFSVNVTGTMNAQRAANQCERFVHVSTPSVAFTNVPTMAVGTEPPFYRGRDAYARSKALGEQWVLEHLTVPTVIVRPHLVWGPGDTQLVERIIERARHHRLFLPDHGRALLDATYIDDAAAAIVAALDAARPESPAISRAWVVTSADPRPAGELIRGILEAAGRHESPRSIPSPIASLVGHLTDRLWLGTEPPITNFAARQLSVAHWFDQREVHEALRWRPTVSVDEGLQQLSAWFLNAARASQS